MLLNAAAIEGVAGLVLNTIGGDDDSERRLAAYRRVYPTGDCSEVGAFALLPLE
jgi:hypothetical protein